MCNRHVTQSLLCHSVCADLSSDLHPAHRGWVKVTAAFNADSYGMEYINVNKLGSASDKHSTVKTGWEVVAWLTW